MNSSSQLLLDRAELRKTAEVYAQGADRRDKQAWQSVMCAEIVMEGPGFRAEGLEANLSSLDVLDQMFRKTQHRVFNQIVDVNHDDARGETYSIAEHLLNDSDEILVWSIRYQDKWRREGKTWRFLHRRLIVDWQETRPVTLLEI